MATKNTKRKASSKAKKRVQKKDDRSIKLIVGIVLIVLGVFLFATTSFASTGKIGEVIGNYLKGTMGVMGIVFPFYIIIVGLIMIVDKKPRFRTDLFLVSLVAFLMLCLINSGRFIDADKIVFDAKGFFEDGSLLKSGGLFGMGLASLFVKYIGKIGLYILSFILLALCLFILFINSPAKLYINSIISKKQDITLTLEERKKERDERRKIEKKQEEEIRAKKERVAAIKEDNKRRRQELKEMAGEDKSLISRFSKISLFPSEHEIMPETSGSVSQDIGPETINSYGNYGIEAPRVSEFGKGLGEDEPDVSSWNPADTTKEEIEISGAYEEPANEKEIAVVQPKKPEVSTESTEKSTNKKISKSEFTNAKLDEKDINTTKKPSKYKKPPIDLLTPSAPSSGVGKSQTELQQMAELLENTLRSFNVDAKVINVTQGPSVTRYEIQPNVGVKVNKIVNLADDIALNLRAKTIRIEAPIPGRAAVGIEVGNDAINMVRIRELIDSKEFKKSESKISFVVGKDIGGKPIIADLKSMPHLLIAGSTGSGKSVCINSIITSILYKADPDEVKLILIDPKTVELGDYNGIPHLLTSVVTDPTKAAAALNWAVATMTERYKLFADVHVRDLESYNAHARMEGLEVLPQIVIIIDELADLMMAAHAQVEESIVRLAQLARAAGMHLIVATQRPSVNVVTGLIKANIPSRIAFAVASQYDSKTILDMGGAEKLGGKGDMLYAPLGQGTPLRVQGTFIDNDEIHNIIDYVKSQKEAEYSEEVTEAINKGDVKNMGSESEDDLYDEAVRYVIEKQKASTSLIQRRFRIGYNRAANLIEAMEANGIIGPADGAKPRQVYVTEVSDATDYEDMSQIEAYNQESDYQNMDIPIIDDEEKDEINEEE